MDYVNTTLTALPPPPSSFSRLHRIHSCVFDKTLLSLLLNIPAYHANGQARGGYNAPTPPPPRMNTDVLTPMRDLPRIGGMTAFQEGMKDRIFYWRFVNKINRSENKNERIFLVTSRHVLLLDTALKIKRLARVADVSRLARQTVSGERRICIAFNPGIYEPTLRLILRNDDSRNPQRNDRDPLEVLNKLRYRLVGEATPILDLSESDSFKESKFHLGNFGRCDRYQTPRDKLASGTAKCTRPAIQALSGPDAGAQGAAGGGQQAAAAAGTGPVNSLLGPDAMREGASVEIVDGTPGIITRNLRECALYRVCMATPKGVQYVKPSDLNASPHAVNPQDVCQECIVSLSHPGETLFVHYNNDLLVEGMEAGPAKAAGLELGRQLLSINNTPVKTSEDVLAEVTKMREAGVTRFPVVLSEVLQDLEQSLPLDSGDDEDADDSAENAVLQQELHQTRLSLSEIHRQLQAAIEERNNALQIAHQSLERERIAKRGSLRSSLPSQAITPRQRTHSPKSSLEHALGSLLLTHIRDERSVEKSTRKTERARRHAAGGGGGGGGGGAHDRGHVGSPRGRAMSGSAGVAAAAAAAHELGATTRASRSHRRSRSRGGRIGGFRIGALDSLDVQKTTGYNTESPAGDTFLRALGKRATKTRLTRERAATTSTTESSDRFPFAQVDAKTSAAAQKNLYRHALI